MTLPRFMRTNEGTPVEIIHQGTDTITDTNGATVIGLISSREGTVTPRFYLPGGEHPNGQKRLSLRPYKALSVEWHKMPAGVATAIATLHTKVGHEIAAKALAAALQCDPSDAAHHMRKLYGTSHPTPSPAGREQPAGPGSASSGNGSLKPQRLPIPQ